MASRDMIGSKVDGLEESRRALEKIIRAEMAAIPGALELIGQQLTTEVKRRAPVATGTLRRSYNWETGTEGRDAWVEVGSNVDYACVLGAATSVVTDEGARRISAIRKGDHVLTQTGEYRPVVHVWKFPVTEKPDLVTIRARWRKGRDHTVTVTADHKVLVHRDGRNVWLPAAGLIVGDVMWKRRKVAANAGYVATNPGPSTWVDIETFDPAEVLEARQWTWEKGAGQRPPMLYDLGVDGVHSFVAHGLVVSNSYQEFGTSRQEGTPHLRPAVDALRPQIRALLAEHVGRGGAGAFRGIGGGLAGVARTLAGLARGGATL